MVYFSIIAAVLALVFAFLMGLSRIYLVVHYPSDVLGGLLVGTIAGIIATLIASNLIPKRFYQIDFIKQKPKAGKHTPTA